MGRRVRGGRVRLLEVAAPHVGLGVQVDGGVLLRRDLHVAQHGGVEHVLRVAASRDQRLVLAGRGGGGRGRGVGLAVGRGRCLGTKLALDPAASQGRSAPLDAADHGHAGRPAEVPDHLDLRGGQHPTLRSRLRELEPDLVAALVLAPLLAVQVERVADVDHVGEHAEAPRRTQHAAVGDGRTDLDVAALLPRPRGPGVVGGHQALGGALPLGLGQAIRHRVADLLLGRAGRERRADVREGRRVVGSRTDIRVLHVRGRSGRAVAGECRNGEHQERCDDRPKGGQSLHDVRHDPPP